MYSCGLIKGENENTKNYSTDGRQGGKKVHENRRDQTNSKMVDLNPTVSIITLN